MSRIARRRLGDWAAVLASLAFAIVLGVLIHQVGVMRQQLSALEMALGDEQANVEDLGGEPVAPEAEDLLEDPEYEPLPGPKGEQGPGPTDEQVYAAVSAYFTAHPVEDGENASPAAIAAAVGNYLAENPPEQGEPGPPPDGEQVASAVQAYLIANPPPAGPPGADGEDGADATPEAIASEVAAYMETHPIEHCWEGYSLVAHTVLTTDGPTDQVDCVADEQS